jgi:hypothetical protein
MLFHLVLRTEGLVFWGIHQHQLERKSGVNSGYDRQDHLIPQNRNMIISSHFVSKSNVPK